MVKDLARGPVAIYKQPPRRPSATAMSNDEMKRAGLDRIKARLERRVAVPTSFDSFDLFAEEPKRWTDGEVRAWTAFEEFNLNLDGRFCTGHALEDIVKYPDSGRALTLFFERRMVGAARDITSRRCDECPLLFEGAYAGHHSDERLALVKGYDEEAYCKFIQGVIEAFFDLRAGTLVPEQVRFYGDLAPLCVRLAWPQRGISFYVECDRTLYDVAEKDQRFAFYARWLVRTNTLA